MEGVVCAPPGLSGFAGCVGCLFLFPFSPEPVLAQGLHRSGGSSGRAGEARVTLALEAAFSALTWGTRGGRRSVKSRFTATKPCIGKGGDPVPEAVGVLSETFIN